jgi:hypothetical protein
MKEPGHQYHVVIPPERGKIVRFHQDDLPGVAAINSALAEFEPKIVFAWHLSLMLKFSDLAANGMPSRAEREVAEPFTDRLDACFKGGEEGKPNAIFLARVTWNATQELVYRVFDPEPVNQFLQRIIAEKAHPRDFDYRIDHDPEWKRAKWHLEAGEKKAGPAS